MIFILASSSHIEATRSYKDVTSLIRNGAILTLFSIELLSLAYIIPLFGYCLILYGCYLIKNQNIHFKETYYLAWSRLLLLLLNFLIDWTTFYNNNIIGIIQIVLSTVATCLFFYKLNLGLEQICVTNGVIIYNSKLKNYIPLYCITLCWNLFFSNLGALSALLSLIFLILNVLYLIFALNAVGKSVSSLTTRFPKKFITRTLIYEICFGSFCYMLLVIFVCQITNKGIYNPNILVTASSKKQQPTLEKIQQLVTLGMDDFVAFDLSEAELEFYSSVYKITKSSSSFHYGGGTLELFTYHCNLLNDQTRVLFYYRWLKPPTCRFYDLLEGTVSGSPLEHTLYSQTLFDLDMLDDRKTYTIPSITLGTNEKGNPFVKQKLSNKGYNYRGYLGITTESMDAVVSTFTYYHQHSILNVPYTDIIDVMNHSADLSYNTIFDAKENKLN